MATTKTLPCLCAGLAAAFTLAAANAALAQAVEPWRAPVPPPPAPAAPATSTPAATAPAASEQHDARELATAVFSQPAAAERAAEQADAKSQPDYTAVQPKPEWSANDGVRVGGKGVQIKTPF